VTSKPVIVVEDDPFTRLIQIALDPNTPDERVKGFADFMAHDEPDFSGWIARVRKGSANIFPAEVRLVESEDAMRANLKDAVAVVTESLRIGADDLAAGGKLQAVQKFGTGLRNIDTDACAKQGVKVLTLRRRANISCAEHFFALMLTLARRMETISGLVTAKRIKDAGITLKPFDRRHTPGGNFPRVGGLKALNESTIGIVGFGEIGKEIALRARAFGMRVLYHQRTRAPEAEERESNANYVSLPVLMAESDWIAPQVPTLPSTRNLIGRDELSRMKPGACIVNVANAPIINREALIEALRGGKLGGVAMDIHYQEPVPDDDELLSFENVLLTPRMAGSPRHNGLKDFEQLITGLAREIKT
jgi:phosphoglycerate dehydrogenase-like enzyme